MNEKIRSLEQTELQGQKTFYFIKAVGGVMVIIVAVRRLLSFQNYILSSVIRLLAFVSICKICVSLIKEFAGCDASIK